ncbi:Metallo-hydrolase/oxidoreductase [Aspergillus spinulosporus]
MATRIPFDETIWQDYLAEQEAQLPALPDVESLSNRVVRILAGNPGTMQLQGTNTYLVGTGTARILIDTGEGKSIWLNRITAFLKEKNLTIAYILLTHWHGDHAGGVPSLIQYKPELENLVYKNKPDRGQNPIIDGQKFEVEGASVQAVFTPGHAIDHMCFLLEEENALFTGDNVLGHGYSVVQDLAEYMNSLSRMKELGCAVGYPGHGAKIEALAGKLLEYIQHNELRVQQVIKALSWNGRIGMTVPEIVRTIYGEVPMELVENAISPFLLQVLWKLAEERKVGFELGDSNRRRWFGLC